MDRESSSLSTESHSSSSVASSLRPVAALYVDKERGPYASMPGVIPWGVEDDARTYDGPYPVVAHPSCAPWGRFRWRSGGGDSEKDGPRSCALFGVDQVRTFGGVLEHPAGSFLWSFADLPRPGEEPDEWGGYTLSVRQVDWGHPAEKRTWLYIVGVPPEELPPMPPPREPTHVIVSSKEGSLPELPKSQRHLTPPAFAEWLVEVARRAEAPASSPRSRISALAASAPEALRPAPATRGRRRPNPTEADQPWLYTDEEKALVWSRYQDALTKTRQGEWPFYPSASSLAYLHMFLFEGVRSFAGRMRSKDSGDEYIIVMGQRSAHRSKVIEQMDNLFKALRRAFGQLAEMREDASQETSPERRAALAEALREEAASVVAYFYLQFIVTQPFMDGNKRTSRLYFDQMLAELGLPLAMSQLGEDVFTEALLAYFSQRDSKFLARHILPVLRLSP